MGLCTVTEGPWSGGIGAGLWWHGLVDGENQENDRAALIFPLYNE